MGHNDPTRIDAGTGEVVELSARVDASQLTAEEQTMLEWYARFVESVFENKARSTARDVADMNSNEHVWEDPRSDYY